MKKILYYVLFFLSVSFQVKAYSLSAEISSPVVPVGQEFVLTILADEQVSEQPNLSALKNKFKVFSTSVSTQVFINNGQQSAQTSWKIGLAAKSTGKQEIPSIKVGVEQTEPLEIEVVEQAADIPDLDNSSQPEYAIETRIVNQKPKYYVQEQILYNVIVKDKGVLQSGEPVFNSASGNDWIIKSLGDPEILKNRVNGHTERQITFKYALFPQKSGRLKIPAIDFTGMAYADGAIPSFDPFGNGFVNISLNFQALLNINTPINLFVPEKEIEILPAPKDYKGNWWLPAENVTLKSAWMPPHPKLKQGEAVTREITLEAVGITDSQLPALNLMTTSEIKQYPQKTTKKQHIANGKIISVQEVNNVYIPKKSGMVTIPEISVDWFNTETGKIEKAVLPAQTVEVEAVAEEKHSEPAVGMMTQEALPRLPQKEDSVAQKNETLTTKSTHESLWLAVAFLSGLIFALLLTYWRRPKEVRPACEPRRYPDFILKKSSQKDFRALRDALVAWAEGYYPDKRINNLKDVAAAAGDKAFEDQINLLLSMLYQVEGDKVWNAKIFNDAFKRVLKKEDQKNKNIPPLPSLYD